jgi:Tfp pilus assembly protein PilE
MKSILLPIASAFLLVACQQQAGENSPAEGESAAKTALAADANVCDRYVAFVESYAKTLDKDVAKALTDRLEYDKQRWPTIDKKEADEYCAQSLARMERMAGN